MADVMTFPTAGPPPAPTGDPFLDLIELRIIRKMSEHLDYSRPIEVARGLSIARSDYLATHPDVNSVEDHPDQYLSVLFIALHRMTPRARAKLRHPARTRAEAQRLMNGERP